VHGPLDAHGAGGQVEVGSLQAEQLSSTQPAPGGEEDQGTKAGVDGIGERVDVADGGDRSLGGSLDAGALDLAGATDDDLVGHRCAHHGPPQPVGLGRGRRTGSLGAAQAGVPGADLGGAQAGQGGVIEVREDVTVEEALVQLAGTRTKVAAMRHPLAGPLGQRDVSHAGVHPRPTGAVGSLKSGPGRCIASGAEGAGVCVPGWVSEAHVLASGGLGLAHDDHRGVAFPGDATPSACGSPVPARCSTSSASAVVGTRRHLPIRTEPRVPSPISW